MTPYSYVNKQCNTWTLSEAQTDEFKKVKKEIFHAFKYKAFFPKTEIHLYCNAMSRKALNQIQSSHIIWLFKSMAHFSCRIKMIAGEADFISCYSQHIQEMSDIPTNVPFEGNIRRIQQKSRVSSMNRKLIDKVESRRLEKVLKEEF